MSFQRKGETDRALSSHVGGDASVTLPAVSRGVKVALLTPYWGGNLGDAAIQTAVIESIRERFPEGQICLISLSPEATTRLHNVPSFPLAILPVEHYSSGRGSRKRPGAGAIAGKTPRQEELGQGEVSRQRVGERTALGRLKAAVKASPLLSSSLRPLYNALIIVPTLAFEEVRHIIRAYELLRDVNCLVVSGGGQLDDYYGGPWGHPYALLKWGFLAKAAGAKFVFLSVGTCALESKLSAFFIRNALRFATYRSYRDQTSKELLPQMPFTSADAVCPDLAFSYVSRGPVCGGATGSTGKMIGVSPIAYLSAYGWPKRNVPVYERYLSTLVAFITDLLRRGYSIKLFSTDVPDRNVVADIVTRLAGDEPILEGRVSYPRTETLEEFFHTIATVDYVVASRLHGILLSHLCRTPVMAISYDRKVDTYMQDMRLSKYCLNLHDVSVESLVTTFVELTANSTLVREELDRRARTYADALRLQYDRVFLELR